MHGQILAKPHCEGPRYQQTWLFHVVKASLVVDTVSEAVTTGLTRNANKQGLLDTGTKSICNIV